MHVIPDTARRAKFPLATVPGAAEEFGEDQVNTGQALLKAMDAAGVDGAVVINSRFLGFDNRYCTEVVHEHPGRLAGVANIDAFDPSAPSQVAELIDGNGLHGVRIWGGAMYTDRRACATWVDDASLLPTWKAIAERGIPCNAQKTFPEALPGTRRLLRRVDGLRLTLNNLAQAPVAEGRRSEHVRALLAMAEFPTVYVSFSTDFAGRAAVAGSPEREVMEGLLEAFGAGRLMWSAFYPSDRSRPYPDSVAELRQALSSFSGAEQTAILGGAARSLYPALAA
jgi:L-fuconolactonase